LNYTRTPLEANGTTPHPSLVEGVGFEPTKA
jgi:hypothetical protein